MSNKTKIKTEKIVNLEEGDIVDGFYIIKKIDEKKSKSEKIYYDMDITDDTGTINAKIWEEKKGKAFKSYDFVKIRGEVTLWNNQKQLKVNKLRKIEESDGVDIDQYVLTAPIKGEVMYNDIYNDYIETMENEDIKKLVKIVVEDNKEKILYYPAAKENHHSIKAGLLYHIYRMLKSGEKLLEVYSGLDKDLLYAGIILHDLSKIDEMESNELGIVAEYTKEGKLLGHIIQGIKNISRVARENNIDEESSLLIEHMILSHHYYPEYGSPRFPMIPEGELLHYLDIIDARMYDMQKALSEVEEGEFTNRIWTLDNRQLYKKREIEE